MQLNAYPWMVTSNATVDWVALPAALHTDPAGVAAERQAPLADTQPSALTQAELTPLDPSAVLMLSILACLQQTHMQGRPQMPLAALCKQLACRMSTLQRLMTALSEQSLVQVQLHKDRLVACLTAEGAALTSSLSLD